MRVAIRRNLTPLRRARRSGQKYASQQNISKSHSAYWNLIRGHQDVWHNPQDIWKLRSSERGSRGGLERYVDLCYSRFALAGVYKRGADTNCPERQSALNYKSLQTALCARCRVMRRHLSCFSPVWGQRVWKLFELYRHYLTWRKWRINTQFVLFTMSRKCQMLAIINI